MFDGNDLEALAGKLVDFYKEFDFYDYQDNYENEEDAIYEMKDALSNKNRCSGIIASLKKIDNEELLEELISKKGNLINEIDKFYQESFYEEEREI